MDAYRDLSFTHLPIEILYEIFCFVPPVDLFQYVSIVCHSIRNLLIVRSSHAENFWYRYLHYLYFLCEPDAPLDEMQQLVLRVDPDQAQWRIFLQETLSDASPVANIQDILQMTGTIEAYVTSLREEASLLFPTRMDDSLQKNLVSRFLASNHLRDTIHLLESSLKSRLYPFGMSNRPLRDLPIVQGNVSNKRGWRWMTYTCPDHKYPSLATCSLDLVTSERANGEFLDWESYETREHRSVISRFAPVLLQLSIKTIRFSSNDDGGCAMVFTADMRSFPQRNTSAMLQCCFEDDDSVVVDHRGVTSKHISFRFQPQYFRYVLRDKYTEMTPFRFVRWFFYPFGLDIVEDPVFRMEMKDAVSRFFECIARDDTSPEYRNGEESIPFFAELFHADNQVCQQAWADNRFPLSCCITAGIFVRLFGIFIQSFVLNFPL